MRKDIEIPVSKDVFVVAIQEWNDDFMQNTWYAYLLNETNEKLEMCIIVSKAYGKIDNEDRETGTFRHVIKEIKPDTREKIELLEESVLQLNNEFMVTYFIGNTFYEKKFTFHSNSITSKSTQFIKNNSLKVIFSE